MESRRLQSHRPGEAPRDPLNANEAAEQRHERGPVHGLHERARTERDP